MYSCWHCPMRRYGLCCPKELQSGTAGLAYVPAGFGGLGFQAAATDLNALLVCSTTPSCRIILVFGKYVASLQPLFGVSACNNT